MQNKHRTICLFARNSPEQSKNVNQVREMQNMPIFGNLVAHILANACAACITHYSRAFYQTRHNSLFDKIPTRKRQLYHWIDNTCRSAINPIV